MRKLLLLFLTATFCGCSNNQPKDPPQTSSAPSTTEQVPVEQRFFSRTIPYDSIVNGAKRRTLINCSFYQRNEGIGAAMAIDIFNAALQKMGPGDIQKSEQRQPSYVDTIAVELHTATFERAINPLPPGNDKGVEKSINLLLPDLFQYWHDCNVPFSKKYVSCVYAGYTASHSSDPGDTLRIVLSGGIFYQYGGDMRWFVRNQPCAQSFINASFRNDGESNLNLNVTKVPPNQWRVSIPNDADIVIDAANTPKAEAIETACLEMTHRAIEKSWVKKMAEHLNAPPYYSNYEPVIKEYLRLNEVAVHYTMICFMEEVFKKGLCDKKDIPNPLVQYRSETYAGLTSLLKRYPPSLKNGMMVMRAFMKDPMNINKF